MTRCHFDLADEALAALIVGLEGQHADAEGVSETLARLEAQDRTRSAAPALAARREPACCHLPAALTSARQVDRTLGEALGALAPLLHWQRIPDHVPHPPGPFMEDYAFAKIFGPRGVYPGADFMLGLFIIGPGQFYPAHQHAAPELYWLLSGPTEWQFSDNGPWITKQAGDLRWNRPHEPHAMRTSKAVFFALWAWTRDIDGDYSIVGAEGPSPLNQRAPR